MFVDLTNPEREKFIKQTTGSHIPGYTGHCPTLKFRYGQRYGANTKEIIEELKDRSPIHGLLPYRSKDPGRAVLCDIRRDQGQNQDLVVRTSLPKRPYILGYTGYIPGLNFQYGTSFRRAADNSVVQFECRLNEEETQRERERMQCINTKPKMSCIRGRDDVTSALEHYNQRIDRTMVTHISPELPPIAGYTGHIPRLKGSEASLSQRYYSSAKKGLSILRDERDQRCHIEDAKESVKNTLALSHRQT